MFFYSDLCFYEKQKHGITECKCTCAEIQYKYLLLMKYHCVKVENISLSKLPIVTTEPIFVPVKLMQNEFDLLMYHSVEALTYFEIYPGVYRSLVKSSLSCAIFHLFNIM